MKTKYIFIIDTDSYAGNFERDMCAYLTGVVGDCGVGEEYKELYFEDTGEGEESIFSEYLEFRADDEHGCHRPTSIWKTKGWLSVGGNDKAVLKKDWNQAEADAAWQESQAGIYRGYLKQVENVVIGVAGWTKESKAKAIARHQKDIERCLKSKSPKLEPYNSVAIFFEKKPTEEMVKLMKERALKFSETKRKIAEEHKRSWDMNFQLTIHGFRLIKESTRETEERI